MSKSFVAYARRDREKVVPIVRALEANGNSIWWDMALTPGVNFAEEIIRQLEEAESVILCWSEAALKSEWFMQEAKFAHDKGIPTVSVRLDKCDIPSPFNEFQFLDLSNWEADFASKELFSLVFAVNPEKRPRVYYRRLGIAPSRNSFDEERTAWAITQGLNSLEAYQHFKKSYPSGQFVAEAQRRISNLQVGETSTNVFISYRRQDSKAVARLIYEHLKFETIKGQSTSKSANIFFDVVSIPPGESFKTYIKERLIQCQSAIVVIGPQWTGRRGMFGTKITQKNDFVRMEVEIALELGLRLIPVITDERYLPKPSKLPSSIREICNRQAAHLNLGKGYEADIKMLTEAAIGSQ